MRITVFDNLIDTDNMDFSFIILNELSDERPEKKFPQLFEDTVAFGFVFGVQQGLQCSVPEKADDIQCTQCPCLHRRYEQCLLAALAENVETQL